MEADVHVRLRHAYTGIERVLLEEERVLEEMKANDANPLCAPRLNLTTNQAIKVFRLRSAFGELFKALKECE